MLIIFNLIIVHTWGGGLGRWRGEKGPLPLALLLLFYCDCLCLPLPHHPIPLLSGCGSIFYPSPLPSPPPNPSAPTSRPPFVSCSFLGFCTTQLVYTVYTQPAKRKPNSKHFISRLECLCPAASGWAQGWRKEKGSGVAMWLLWKPPEVARLGLLYALDLAV